MNISYVAGLFDGEGYVRISKWKKPKSPHIRYALVVGINMTYRPIIEMLQKDFGGGLHSNRYDLRNKNQRCGFCWVLGSQAAASFLRLIQPHVIVKKDQVDLALEFQANIDGNPYTPRGRPGKRGVIMLRENRDELMSFREDCFHRILAMKKETFAPFGPKPFGRPKRMSLTA